MAASSADYFKKVGLPGGATSLAAPGHSIGGTAFTVDSTSLWPTDTGVTFAIDTTSLVNGVETRVEGSYTVWDGVVASGTTITGGILRYGNDQNYSAGSSTRVYILPTSVRENKIIDGLLVSHNNTGTLKTQAVRDALNLDAGTSTGWTVLGYAPDTVTALGNRSYSMVFNGNDLTATVSPGMRLRATRTVAAPTQCTSLNGTTQYFNKTTPAGMTFTDDFVVSAWVKLSAYGANSSIISRYNGTSGYDFSVIASGQIQLAGFNGGAANNTKIVSYQSIPLNKWVHVAAELDMSTGTNTATTNYVMIDGVDVPALYSQAGTNPTALIQAGNLEIGSRNGGTQFFPGKIAQVAIYSAKVTQATILASMPQTLVGNETSLISAYSFSNAITDLNANANDLTAQGSAVATNADSPFAQGTGGTLEYGIIAKTAFSTNTTLTVQVPEGCALPTTGGISAVSYSTQAVPYGFPKQTDKWDMESIYRVAMTTTSNATFGAFNSAGCALKVPIGAWRRGWEASAIYNSTTTAVSFSLSSTALTGGAYTTAPPETVRIQSSAAASTTCSAYTANSETLAAMSTFVMYTIGATTSAGIDGPSGQLKIFANNGYL